MRGAAFEIPRTPGLPVLLRPPTSQWLRCLRSRPRAAHRQGCLQRMTLWVGVRAASVPKPGAVTPRPVPDLYPDVEVSLPPPALCERNQAFPYPKCPSGPLCRPAGAPGPASGNKPPTPRPASSKPTLRPPRGGSPASQTKNRLAAPQPHRVSAPQHRGQVCTAGPVREPSEQHHRGPEGGSSATAQPPNRRARP